VRRERIGAGHGSELLKGGLRENGMSSRAESSNQDSNRWCINRVAGFRAQENPRVGIRALIAYAGVKNKSFHVQIDHELLGDVL